MNSCDAPRSCYGWRTPPATNSFSSIPPIAARSPRRSTYTNGMHRSGSCLTYRPSRRTAAPRL
eukprot:6192749-Pleurochrysis_carterae.AAC.2